MEISIIKTSKGFTIFELVTAISILVMIIAVAMPMFKNYQKQVEKKLHIVNALKFQNAIKSGLLEGWITKPPIGQTVEVDLQTVYDNNYFSNMLDPSSFSKSLYKNASFVQVYNNNKTLEFYVKLESKDFVQIYIDTTSAPSTQGSKRITFLEKTDVLLRDYQE